MFNNCMIYYKCIHFGVGMLEELFYCVLYIHYYDIIFILLHMFWTFAECNLCMFLRCEVLLKSGGICYNVFVYKYKGFQVLKI